MGFGDDEAEKAENIKTEIKTETKVENESKPTLGKMQVIGGKTTLGNQPETKKAEWPPSLMDYIRKGC